MEVEQMKRYIMVLSVVLALALVTAGIAAALPGKPDFNPHIYADGKTWGTKVATTTSHGTNSMPSQMVWPDNYRLVKRHQVIPCTMAVDGGHTQ